MSVKFQIKQNCTETDRWKILQQRKTTDTSGTRISKQKHKILNMNYFALWQSDFPLKPI